MAPLSPPNIGPYKRSTSPTPSAASADSLTLPCANSADSLPQLPAAASEDAPTCLVNTSSEARSYARGGKTEKRSGISSVLNKLLKTGPKDSSRQGGARLAGLMPSSLGGGGAGHSGPDDADRDTAAQGSGEALQFAPDPLKEAVDEDDDFREAMSENSGTEDPTQQSSPCLLTRQSSSRSSESEASAASVADHKAPLADEADRECMSDAGSEVEDEEDDVEGFFDPEDYYSVGSGEDVGSLGDAAKPLRNAWLKPVMRLFGKAGSSRGVELSADLDWPDMSCMHKHIEVSASRVVAKLSIVEEAPGISPTAPQESAEEPPSVGAAEPGAENPDSDHSEQPAPEQVGAEAAGGEGATTGSKVGVAEISLAELLWRGSSRYALPAAHADCVTRLSHGVSASEDPLQTRLDIGPCCFPRLLEGTQHMEWPRAEVNVQLDDNAVCILESRDGQDHGLQERAAAYLGGSSTVASHGDGEHMLTMDWKPREAPATHVNAYRASLPAQLQTWPLRVKFHRATFHLDNVSWMFCKNCFDRIKPFLLSKLPSPSLVPAWNAPPAQEAKASDNGGSLPEFTESVEQDGQHLFPTEAVVVEFLDTVFLEPYKAAIMETERRWPLRVLVPRLNLRSNAKYWDFSSILDAAASAEPSKADGLAGGPEVPAADAAEEAEDVTIPKEMFDTLVKRAAETTLKESQLVAAREELQKVYIEMASLRAHHPASLSGLLGLHGTGESQELIPHHPHQHHHHSSASMLGSLGSLGKLGSTKHLGVALGGVWERGWAGLLETGGALVNRTANGQSQHYGPFERPGEPAQPPSNSFEHASAPARSRSSSIDEGVAESCSAAAAEAQGEGQGEAAAAAAAAATSDELERLRRRCAQLESSLASQSLAQRRLEVEHAHFQAIARNELRQVLIAHKAHAAVS
eukprot:TRINITY_DN29668_c0_g2_i9.p1 TRINITY_DN29668_c0_g2~~TRINITY_DN29668_c0_g2_i9.p1  ORF type:complete len:918 (-),score=180.44 TRINITY_DN29668_c0_g2_i9:75-2828(-)